MILRDVRLTFRYNRYQERKAEMNAKFRAKRAREEVEDWDGLDPTDGDIGETKAKGSDSDSDSESEEEIENPVDTLLTSLGPRLNARSKGQLSQRAALFFDRPDFEGIDFDEAEETAVEEKSPEATLQVNDEDEKMEDSASENGFEEVPADAAEPDPWDEDSEDEKPVKPGIEIAFNYLTL